MAKLEIEIDGSKIAQTVRRGIVSEWAQAATNMGLALPVILELLKRNDVVRVMIAEALCVEHEMQDKADLEDPDFENHSSASYDDMIKAAIAELEDTPIGRCERV
tara:strand:+ start:146 stop:460 length:315 start_codon:yes stop_codon:yes gene_type:complete